MKSPTAHGAQQRQSEGKTASGSLPTSGLALATRSVAPENQPSSDVRSYILGGTLVALLLVGGIGGWAATTDIAGAVLASGTVVVDGNVKKVQHLSGGIVGSIHVTNGDQVTAGDLLLRLDDTVVRASHQVITKQLDEMAGRSARLKAERDGQERLVVPEIFWNRLDDPQIGEIIDGEQSLLESRRQTRDGQKAQLRERISQLRDEGDGIVKQFAAKSREVNLIDIELASLKDLEAQRLVTSQKMMAMRREVARLDGEGAQLQAQAAQSKGRIAEIELQILQIDQELKSEIAKELREIQAKEAELVERRVAAEDQLKRVEIRAPQAGLVHQLAVHTVGGVVNPGEPIMILVPQGEKLVIEARLAPQDIDQARASRTASVRFPAFNQRTTPEVQGTVARISPEVTTVQQTGQSYFTARIELADDQIARLDGLKLVPGMPAEVQIRTEDRTVLSYLWKPVADQFSKAFRER